MSRIAVGRLPDARLEFWATIAPGELFTTWKRTVDPDAEWTRRSDFLAEAGPVPGDVTAVAVAPLSDGRLELWAATAQGGLFTTWKLTTDPNADWATWSDFLAEVGPLPGAITALAVAPLSDGRLELWVATAQVLFTTWKLTTDPDADWASWSDFLTEVGPLPGAVTALAVGPLPDGRLELWAATQDTLFTTWKLTTDPDADWSSWSDFLAEVGPLPGTVTALAVAPLSDGRLELWAATAEGLFTTWKLTTDPGADWSSWSDFLAEVGPLPGAVTALTVGPLSDGRLELWAATGQGGLFTTWKLTTDPNADWAPWSDFLAEIRLTPVPEICRAADQYFGDDTTNVSSRNWNGDVTFNPTTWRVPKHRPIDPAAAPPPPGPPFITDPKDGLASLVEAVASATEQGQSLHAFGNGWSFEDCAKSDDVMMSLANLNLQLHDVVDPRNQALTDDWIGKHGNPASRTHLVHFEAGIRIADLCEQLDTQGLAMPTLGGSNGQSLVGAISTSTHGGDWQQPPFPDLVRAVHLVTVGGQELWIESSSQPLTRPNNDNAALLAVLPCATTQIVRDDRIFNAVRAACGRFGVIYSVVLEVRRQFRVVQAVTTPSAASVLQALRDGQKTPSIFTPLFRLLNNDPLPAALTDATGVPYFLQILFNSQRPSDVWVTRRWETTDITKPDILEGPQGSRSELANTIVRMVNLALMDTVGLGGGTALAVSTSLLTLVGGPLGTLIGAQLGSAFTIQVLNVAVELNRLIAQGKPAFGAVLAAALTAAWRIPGLNFLIPQIQGMVIENQLRGGLKADGIRGPHFRVTTGPREDSDQTDFRSDSIEVVFDAASAEYLDFLDEIFTVAPFYQQAGYISLRPSLRSTALLSMHNVSGPRAISIEIASAKDLPGNAGWLSYVHQAAVRFNGRPHWGQYNKLDELSVEMLYAASLQDWREALLSVTGSSTLFSNEFTRQRGLEPKRIVRLVTSVKKTTRDTITHLCNDAEFWSPVPVADAIQQIQAGTAIYIAVGAENFSLIEVVSDGAGGFFLRSRPNQAADDNLDNLPLSKKP